MQAMQTIIPERHIVIPGELYSSKNSQRIFRTPQGKPFITKSKRAKEQEENLLIQLRDWRRRTIWKIMTEGKPMPLKVHFLVYRRTHGIFDYGNIIQNVQDCMVKAEYLSEDNARILIPVYEPYIKDPSHPRVLMWVE